ncbi:Hypothetical predicted protein [Octopus vulgaris]|uniref:Uncharacterized protein n=1 Tax=Octopus vulgaris TaxID=6645 RepID=A0AA36F935_OCTVU|nr:Hypothetical predicted protein [Octopus vulgaris]
MDPSCHLSQTQYCGFYPINSYSIIKTSSFSSPKDNVHQIKVCCCGQNVKRSPLEYINSLCQQLPFLLNTS